MVFLYIRDRSPWFTEKHMAVNKLCFLDTYTAYQQKLSWKDETLTNSQNYNNTEPSHNW